ncbi:DUF502 domain-containing protein [Halobium salinum]|uniref:DUF502 domain-containing protein n=1 Tax=Halobium salinum TaxID=1364940 RepID=A0ABD5PFK2_9EURY|nr:DUF502 domain-containing protein [Halobium salinum]
MSSWKRDVASGLVVLLPLLVIAFVVSWVYQKLATFPLIERITFRNVDFPVWFVEAGGEQVLKVILALVVFFMLTLAVGYLMRTTVGRLGEDVLDRVVNFVPGLRVVYNASKLAVETALTGTDELQAPVRIELLPGLRMTAFKTGKRTDDGRDIVFMPTAPNITTGFVIEADPERIEETDEKVEEALTRILSAGFGDADEGVDIDVTDEGIEDLGRVR